MCPDIPEGLIDKVNEALDSASHDLGPSHRSVNHDPISAAATGASVAARLHYDAGMGMRAAAAHLIADKISDRMVDVKVGQGLFGQSVSLKRIFDALT